MATSPTIKGLLSELGIYGVVTVSGLLVIVANQSDTAMRDVLIKVLATVFVLWLAHVYSGAVAHLAGHADEDIPARTRIASALRHSLNHCWGMLVAALIPGLILGLGALGVIKPGYAIWGTLWVNVAILAVLGYLGVSTWMNKTWARLLGALGTGAIGIVMILLKALIH